MSICKVCFEKIPKSGINSFRKDACICQNCFREFNPRFDEFKFEGVNVLSIYEYDETIRKYLFELKGCYDYELKDIFLSRFRYELKLKYRNYVIVPFPSSSIDDELRQFNHVEEIFKVLDLPIIHALKKKFAFKQSDLSKREREKIGDKIELINKNLLTNKKVLIVDDVMTTGSSIKCAISLIKSCNPKSIKVALLARKREFKKDK